MEPREILTTDVAEVYIDNGILHVAFVTASLDLAAAQAHMEKVKNKWASKFPLPALVNNAALKNTSKEARDYFASTEMSAVFCACAAIINSSFAKIAGNLFLKFSKPQYPIKLFTPGEEAKALEWLEAFKK